MLITHHSLSVRGRRPTTCPGALSPSGSGRLTIIHLANFSGCLLAPGPGLALGEQGPAPCFTKCSSSKGPWRVHTEVGDRLETVGCQGKVNGSDTSGGLHGGGGPELQDKRGDVRDRSGVRFLSSGFMSGIWSSLGSHIQQSLSIPCLKQIMPVICRESVDRL